MKRSWTLMAALCVATASWMTPMDAAKAKGFRECRQPNYLAKNGKIYAVDPDDTSVENEIRIKGVSWSGMEKENMILDGLWGTEQPNENGVTSTKISTMLEFLTNNSFNSIRLPLNADYINRDTTPQVGYMHSYENQELVTFEQQDVKYFDLLGRVIEVFGEKKLTVLLDIHLLDRYASDAYWYTAPHVNITDSAVYQAISYLTKALCDPVHWNVIGIDLKDGMTDVQWNAKRQDSNIKSDWQQAAEVLANRVVELCPQWLVFVGGASSPTKYQKFAIAEEYRELSDHWVGGNLKNATLNPIKMAVENKLVYAPHTHTHGMFPRNYFYSSKSNCSTDIESSGKRPECIDFIDGEKQPSKLSCSRASFGCTSYAHLPEEDLLANYKHVLNEAIGDVVKEQKAPVVFGAFSGVYGPHQPQQSIVLDYLIDVAASDRMQGGYYWSLNPDTEYYLEDAQDSVKKSGLFGSTHFGLMKVNNWQEPNQELLDALKRMPSSDIPCYGEKGGSSDATSTIHGMNGIMGMLLSMVWLLAMG